MNSTASTRRRARRSRVTNRSSDMTEVISLRQEDKRIGKLRAPTMADNEAAPS